MRRSFVKISRRASDSFLKLKTKVEAAEMYDVQKQEAIDSLKARVVALKVKRGR